jgi:RNA polymerase sigma factor (sigma-70 family)
MNLDKWNGKTRGNHAEKPKWLERLIGDGYVTDQTFSSSTAEERLFGPSAAPITVPAWTQFPEPDDEDVPVRSRRTALSGRDEAALFLRYNYARLRLDKILARSGSRPLGKDFQLWYGRMMECKESIARANMALVVAMAKRTRIPNVEFSELVSEGNMALLRSIEKFDVARGFKFSTYACRSILKSFNRLATKTGRYRRLFPTEFDPELEQSDPEARRDETERKDALDELHEVLKRNRAGLSPLERRVLNERFPGGPKADRVRTLAEVGQVVGLTNERVRQIQNAALTKLRAVMVEEPAHVG